MATIDRTGSNVTSSSQTTRRDPAPSTPTPTTPAATATTQSKTTAQRVAEGLSSFVDAAKSTASRGLTELQANYELNLVARQDEAILRGGADLDSFDAEVRTAAAAGLVGQQMLGALESQRGAPMGGGAAVEALGALDTAKRASEATGALSEQLQATLEQLGPATTDAERDAITSEFQKLHQDAYTAEGEANKALATQLEALGRTGVTPGDAQTMVEGLTQLSTDPTYAQFVADQSGALLAKSGNDPWKGQTAALAELSIDAATTRALSAGGEPSAVQAAVDAANRALSAVAVSGAAPEAVRQMTEARELLGGLASAVRDGKTADFIEANADAIAGLSSSESPLEKSLGRFTATLSTVRAMADVGTYLNSDASGTSAERLSALLSAGGSAAEVIEAGLQQTRGLMHAAADAGLMSKGAAVSAGATLRDMASGLGKVAGYLGAGSAVLGTFIDANAALENPTVGNIGKAIGSTMAAAGSVMSLVGANTVGGPIAWAGTAIGLGSWAYQAASDRRAFVEEGTKLLAPVLGGDEELARQLMTTPGLDRLEAAGLSVEQIRDAVSRLEAQAPGSTFLAAQLIERTGASPQEAADFIAKARPELIEAIVSSMNGGLGVAAPSAEALREQMADAARNGA